MPRFGDVWPWLLCAFFVLESVLHFASGGMLWGTYFLAVAVLYPTLVAVQCLRRKRRGKASGCGGRAGRASMR